MKLGSRLCPCFRKNGTFENFVAFCSNIQLETVDCSELTAEIAAICKKHNMAIGSVDGMFPGLLSDDAQERANAGKEAKARIDAIADNGGSILFTVVLPPDQTMSRAQSFENWKRSWPDVVAHAEKRAVRIAMEPWPGPPPGLPTLGTTPEMLRAMFTEIPSPALGLCYDPSHFVRLRIDYLRVLAEFGEKIVHVHLKDTEIIDEGLYQYGILGPSFRDKPHRFGDGYWRYTIPGDGCVDWKAILHRLSDVGYDGVLSIELEDHYYTATTELQKQGIETAASYIRGIRHK